MNVTRPRFHLLRVCAPLLVVPLGLASPLARAAVPVPTRVVAIAPADGKPIAKVTVDATAMGASAEVVARQVDEGARAILEGNGLVASDAAEAPEIVLTVAPLGEGKPGYRCDYEIRQDGAVVPGSASFSDCRLCTESELVETAQAAVESQLDTLRELGAPKVPEPAGDEGGDDGSAADGGGDFGADDGDGGEGGGDDLDRPGGLGTLGKVGIGVGVVGIAALVPGIILAVLPPKPIANADRRTTTVPGAVLAAGGGAALITGAVLLGIDLGRRKRRSQARLHPSPVLGPDFAGASLSGRF